MSTRIYIFLVYLLSTFVRINATTYYISNSLGNDSNSGLSLQNPIKTISRLNTFNFYLFHEIPCHCGARYIYPSDLQVTIATVWPIKLVLRLENNCKNDINHPIFLSQTCY